VITDFQPNVDVIDVDSIDAKVGAANPGDQDFTFIGDDAFTAAGQVRIVAQGGNTIVQLSTDNDVQAESEIQLTGNVSLAATDFLL
jgi:serralysin